MGARPDRSPYVMSMAHLLDRIVDLEKLAVQERTFGKLKRYLPKEPRETWENRLRVPFRILHLSDIHFGDYQIDRKNQLQPKELLKDLQQIRKLPIDFLVVSGDITSNTNADRSYQAIEYEEAKQFISQLGQDLGLEKKHWIVVPGNHDVMWYSPDEPSIKSGKVRPQDVNYRNFYLNLYGETPATPYLGVTHIDHERNVAIMALNSCILENDSESGWIGYVGDNQLEAAWQELSRQASGKLDELIKIAVLHHHLVPVSYVEEIPREQKKVSLTMDAEGIIKKLLLWGFDVALHGHQHQPFIAIESRFYQGDIHIGDVGLDARRSTVIVGGGSLGAPSNKVGRIGRNTYNIVECNANGIVVHIRQNHLSDPTGFTALTSYTIPRI